MDISIAVEALEALIIKEKQEKRVLQSQVDGLQKLLNDGLEKIDSCTFIVPEDKKIVHSFFDV